MRLGVLLAAGASTRFGADDKLLAPWRSRPLVRWAAEALCRAGCEDLVAVVASPAVAAVLPSGFVCRRVPPGQPMSASVRVAVDEARLRQARGLLLCLGDMPNVTPDLLRRLLALPGSCACREGGRRLPPAYIDAADFAQALTLSRGDHGARDLIAGLPADGLVSIDRDMAHDVDRPGDLEGLP